MYTNYEYTQKVIEANNQGEFLYILKDVHTGNETLVIAPENYYIIAEGDNITYGEINPDYLDIAVAKFKDALRRRALLGAKSAISNGTIEYHGLTIETNSSTISDIDGALTVMEVRGVLIYNWYDKNDNTAALTQAQLREIIACIGEFKADIWSKYAMYIDQINNATTLEELKNIVIDYSKEDIEFIPEDVDEDLFLEEIDGLDELDNIND